MTSRETFPRSGTMVGAILAGGESRRMGTDKARLEFDGLPLWQRQARVLREAGIDDLMIVRRPGQPDLTDTLPHRHDAFPGVGPIAGVHTALSARPCVWLAVLAVDMPAIDAVWFAWLARHCRPGCGAVARHADGFEPLAAIYPTTALPAIEARIRRQEYSLQGLVGALIESELMAVAQLPEAERSRVANWNSPADRGS